MSTSFLGRDIGHYRVIAEIGRNSTATVYQAIDRRDQESVALKMFSLEASNENEATRFTDAVQAAAGLQHPNIVSVRGAGIIEERCYVVSQWVTGVTLYDQIKRYNALPPSFAINVARAIASALDYAHSHNFVHEDVKSTSILCGAQGVCLTDFVHLVSRSQRRMSGLPEYLAPEQIEPGQLVTAAADRYSFGVVTYEMLTGRPPFNGSLPQVVYAQVHTQPMPLTSIQPTLPYEIEAIMLRMLAKNPEDRYPDCHTFVTEMAHALHLEKRPPSEAPPPSF